MQKMQILIWNKTFCCWMQLNNSATAWIPYQAGGSRTHSARRCCSSRWPDSFYKCTVLSWGHWHYSNHSPADRFCHTHNLWGHSHVQWISDLNIEVVFYNTSILGLFSHHLSLKRIGEEEQRGGTLGILLKYGWKEGEEIVRNHRKNCWRKRRYSLRDNKWVNESS